MIEKPVLVAEHLSFSSISMYLRCPKQFYWHYVQGISAPPGIAMIEGSAHHEALQDNNEWKKKKGKDLKPRQLTEFFMSTLRKKTQESEVDWAGEDENRLYRRAITWHERYINDLAPGIKPDIIEEVFEKEACVEGEEFVLKGVIDLGYDKKCSDYKTTSDYGFRLKKKGLDSDLQLTFYAWATGRKEVENICFIKKDNPEVVPITSRRTEADIKWALKVAGQVAKSIKQGSFNPCDPTAWQCTPKFCGYYSICRGKK